MLRHAADEEATRRAIAGTGPDGLGLLACAPLPAFLLSPGEAGPVLSFVNPALLALTGRVDADLVGRPLDALACRYGDHGSWARLAERLRVGGGAERIELLLARPGGSLWAEISLVPLPDRPGHYLGQLTDATPRREAEEALALARQREALGLLTNSVAHEFNNFLQILIGYIDGLKRRMGERPEPFMQRAVSRSTEAVERATVLTRQLLAYSRRIAPDVRPVDLNALVEAEVERLRPGLPARVRLEVVPAANLPPALCHPTQVTLALGHIVANACEAMAGEGRIALTTFAVAPGERGATRPGEGAVGLSISDTGHGLSPEMLARALAPFATTREAGRGAGLAIVHGLMKRQGGSIFLESRPDLGATVNLIFPVGL